MNKLKMTLLFGLVVIQQTAYAGGVFGSNNPMALANFIDSHSIMMFLGAFFLFGMLLAFTPCVLPMVPILSGIIVGAGANSTKKGFQLSLSYVLGMAVTYAIAGMLAAYLGSTVQTLMQQTWVISLISLLFVLMALSMFGLFELRMPAAWMNAFQTKKGGGRLLSVFVMGVISTLVVSPCVTAPLIGVLTYISQTGQVAQGGLILFVMALGMGLPLLLVGAGYGRFLPKSGAWMMRVKQVVGLMMLAIAIWMFSRLLTPYASTLLWALFGLSLMLYAALRLFNPNVQKGLTVILSLLVSAIMVGAFVGINKQTVSLIQNKAPFEAVNSVAGIDEALLAAKKAHKAVFIEFFATWCSDCQAMESKVFNQAEIVEAMTPFVNLKVDLSKDTANVQAIKQAFNIYGTPTLLFYNTQGVKLPELSSVGFVDKAKTLSLFKQLA